MKTKIVFLFYIMFIGFSGNSFADEWQNVCVKLKDGTELTFALNSTPRFWFMSEWMYVSVGRVSTEFTTSDVEKVYYRDKTVTALESASKGSTNMIVSVKNDVLCIHGLTDKSIIKMYSLDGKQIAKPTVTSNTEAEINITNLVTGVYVLQVNNTTAKFIKQ